MGVKIAVLNDDMRDVISPSEMSKGDSIAMHLSKADTQPFLLNTLSSRQVGQSPELKSPTATKEKPALFGVGNITKSHEK